MPLRAVTFVLLLTACGARTADDPGASTRAESSDDDDGACAALSRGACMLSVECTLVHVEGERYRCRPSSGTCEEGYAQMAAYDSSPASGLCEARSGCRFVAMDGCYCACRGYGRAAVPDGDEASPCDCESAGGDPGGCVTR